jgi:hypothetical protein
MTPIDIAGVGVCAFGMPEWAAAKSILRGELAWQPAALRKLEMPLLPVTERRRVNLSSRLALHAATQAVAGIPDEALRELSSVFASADGDGQVLASMLEALADDAASMSPTLFHNSVFNAPAGYWTIASRARASSTTVSAGAGSFAAGLLEATIEVSISGQPVLFVAIDTPFPPSLAALGVTGEAFSCAMLLAPHATNGKATCGTIRAALRHADVAQADASDAMPPIAGPVMERFAGNAAAAALPLLAAIAHQSAGTTTLRYLDECVLDLAYRP